MKNALVRLDYRLDLPESEVRKILDRNMLKPDDGSDGWYRSALTAIEAAVADDPMRFLDFVIDEPEVEVDA